MSVTTDLGRLSHAFMPEVRLPLQLHAVRDLGVLVLAIVVAALVLRGPTGPGPRAVRAAALVMLAVTVLSPVVRPWYFLWCLPLLGLTALPYRSTRVLVLATAALGVLEPLSPGTVRWRSESTIAAAALLAVVMVGVAISDPPPRSSLAPHEHQWS
jgi:hypothetical protein